MFLFKLYNVYLNKKNLSHYICIIILIININNIDFNRLEYFNLKLKFDLNHNYIYTFNNNIQLIIYINYNKKSIEII